MVGERVDAGPEADLGVEYAVASSFSHASEWPTGSPIVISRWPQQRAISQACAYRAIEAVLEESKLTSVCVSYPGNGGVVGPSN